MDQPIKRAGRPARKGGVGKQPVNTTAASAAAVPEKRRRGRPSLKAAGDAPAFAETKEKRRPGRPRKSDVSTAGQMVEDRPTAASSPASAPASSGTKRKRGRPKGATTTTAAAAATVVDEADEASTHQAKRRRKSTQARQDEKGDRQNEHEHEHEHTSGDSDESDNSAHYGNDDALPSYGQLVPRMHMVSMATMKRKWAPLEQDAIAAVQALLADCARPVLARLRAGPGGGGAASEQRQEQARQAIAGVTRRLRSKLVKGIPFPPPTVATGGAPKKRRASVAADDIPTGSGGSGVAADFNFERAVEGIQALERQLTPLQHAVALLSREQAREEEALEADYAALRQLQTNAHAESRTWRERARRSHPLLPGDDDDYDDDGDDEDRDREASLELVKRPATPEAEDIAFEDLDKDMVAVATQLGSHLESLRANLQQIEGVVPAMARSQAALLQVLRTHLEPHQFEQILLG